MKALTRLASATLLAVVLGTAYASPALAWDGEDPVPTDPNPHGPADSGDTNVGQVGNCSVVSSPSYLGLSCGSGSAGVVNVAETLGKDPVPECWHEALTSAELTAMNVVNTPGPDGTTWYWQRCVTGISKHPNEFEPHFTVGLDQLKGGDKPTTLTENQELLISWSGKDRTIPAPIAGVSPMARPRVGAQVSFFDGSPLVDPVQAGSVILQAHVASITVQPLGSGVEPTISCNGKGYIAQRGDTPANRPGGCWFKYLRSSAAETDNDYDAWMTAHWVVEVSDDGGATWTTFNQFDKSQITTIPVSEIEALVVR